MTLRILCLPYSHTFSHFARPLSVGLELSRRGHAVSFAGESSKLNHARNAGFEVHALHEPDPEVLYDNIRAGRLQFVSRIELERMIEADVELIGRIRPDVVLTDGRFSAGVSVQLANVRHAAIVNVSSCAYRAHPYVPCFDFLPDWFAPAGSGLVDLLDRFNLWLEMSVFDILMPDFVRLSRRHGLRRKITATNCLTGVDLTLLADIPEYFPTRRLSRDHCYVGPLFWELAPEKPDWWPPKRRSPVLVYVTMGTTGISELFPKLMTELHAAALDAVITTGGQVRGLVPPSAHIHVEEFMDAELVTQACDVVVCHGGNGTIYQALRHGKPVVGIPTIADQRFNMRRVEALGVGLTVDPEVFVRNPEVLVAAIRQVLSDPTFSRAARRLGDALSTWHAPATCADQIESLGARP